MKSIKIGLFSFFLISTVNVFCQDLIIYTNTKSNHQSVVDFNKQLPDLLTTLKESQLKAEIKDLAIDSVKSPTAVLPSIYAFKNGQYYWYRGRYNENSRIVSFARGAGRFQFSQGNQIFNDVFVTPREGFDQITRLKITEVKYQKGFDGERKNDLKTLLKETLESRFYADFSPVGQYKVYYLDVYPYCSSDGKWFLSSQIYSQHHCIKPVAITKQPFSGSEKEAIITLVDWYKEQIQSLYQDTVTGDGLEIIAPEINLKSQQITRSSNQTSRSLALLDFDLKVNRVINDPIRFSFAPPLDNYNGSFSQLGGTVRYKDDTLVGEIKVDISTLDMGEESLNQSVFNQFEGSNYQLARLHFRRVGALVNDVEYSVKATLEFVGKEIDKDIRFTLNQVSKDSTFVNASFELDISDFQTLEKPDGIEPLNSIVYINAQLLLVQKELTWVTQPLVRLPKPTLSKSSSTKSKLDTNVLHGDYILDSGRIEFKTDKYNVNAITTDFTASLNKDGAFKAVVDLSTFTFKKGKLMKKHALGKEGMQVDLFPVASIVGKIPIDFNKTSKQQFSSEATLDIHGINEVVKLDFEVFYKEGQWQIKTMVPVKRLSFNLTGKKANAIDEVVFVEVFVNMMSK